MKKALQRLPCEYSEIFSVNLQKDKNVAVFVNVLAIIIMIALAVPMNFYIPIATLFDLQSGLWLYIAKFASLFILMFCYMILHELTHGVAMKICGTEKVKYGFTGLYAYAGSDDYYNKSSYIFIALLPVIVWGVIIAIINAFVPREWFWVVYFVQLFNISGAAGDIYVTAKFSRLPSDILVTDSGIGMTVYSKQLNV